MQFTDRMTMDASAPRQTDNGLVVHARVARAGNVQAYLGAEMGVEDRQIVRVYRPEDQVFSRDAIQTYARKPITIGHPPGGVTPATWKDLAVGEIDRDVMRDGEFVSVPLLFRDGATIAAIKDGTAPRELSMGYEAHIEMQDGVSPSGEAYDAIMSGFKMNHVALVSTARGGKELRIGDGADRWGACPVHDADQEVTMHLRKIMVDGLSVETTDAGAQAIDKLNGVIAAKDKALADADAAHAKEVAAKDAAIAKAEGERDAAAAKVLDAAALDRMVADRADLIGKAKAIAPEVATAGLADADIRKAVVVFKLGDAMKDKPAAYIDARFDILADDAKPSDPVATVLKDGLKVVTNDGWDAAAAAAGVNLKKGA